MNLIRCCACCYCPCKFICASDLSCQENIMTKLFNTCPITLYRNSLNKFKFKCSPEKINCPPNLAPIPVDVCRVQHPELPIYNASKVGLWMTSVNIQQDTMRYRDKSRFYVPALLSPNHISGAGSTIQGPTAPLTSKIFPHTLYGHCWTCLKYGEELQNSTALTLQCLYS